jgi:hypothetical protein
MLHGARLSTTVQLLLLVLQLPLVKILLHSNQLQCLLVKVLLHSNQLQRLLVKLMLHLMPLQLLQVVAQLLLVVVQLLLVVVQRGVSLLGERRRALKGRRGLWSPTETALWCVE